MALSPAFAEITPAPVLHLNHFEARQQGLLSVWTPVTFGGSITYDTFTCGLGQTLAASSPYWRCCPTTTTCLFPTSCYQGSYYYPGFTAPGTCTNIAQSSCGTQFLLNTAGAADRYTRLVCAESVMVETFFIQKPIQTTSISSTSATSSSGSAGSLTTMTVTPAPGSTSRTGSRKSKTSIGAIVGGVVGGIALLALLAVVLFCLLWRKRKSSKHHATTQAAGPIMPGSASLGGPQQQHGYVVPGVVGGAYQENKYGQPGSHQSYGSPPPMYPHSPNPHQSYYGPDQYGNYSPGPGGMAAAGTQTYQNDPNRNSRPLSMNPVNTYSSTPPAQQYQQPPPQSYQPYRPDSQVSTPVGGYAPSNVPYAGTPSNDGIRR